MLRIKSNIQIFVLSWFKNLRSTSFHLLKKVALFTQKLIQKPPCFNNKNLKFN